MEVIYGLSAIVERQTVWLLIWDQPERLVCGERKELQSLLFLLLKLLNDVGRNQNTEYEKISLLNEEGWQIGMVCDGGNACTPKDVNVC